MLLIIKIANRDDGERAAVDDDWNISRLKGHNPPIGANEPAFFIKSVARRLAFLTCSFTFLTCGFLTCGFLLCHVLLLLSLGLSSITHRKFSGELFTKELHVGSGEIAVVIIVSPLLSKVS